MPNLTLHGVNVFYRDEGKGIPIVLGHSSTGSSGQWRELISRLSKRYRLLAPDHLGYGRTGSHPGKPPLFELEVSIIEALVDLAGAPAHLIGHSYGGSLVSRAALRMPDRVRSLSLIEPTLFHLLRPAGRFDEYAEIKAVADRVVRYVDSGDPQEAARGFIDYWVSKGAYAAMDERLRNAVANGMPKLRAEWLATFDAWGATSEALATIEAPIQLIGATETTKPASAVIDVLREIWPTARHTDVEGAGHLSPITHSAIVNSILEEFVDQNTVRT